MEKVEKIIGKIHSFESFGAVDGPGIRFVVFMQGCFLKCKYCQNRDTWDMCGGKEYTVEEVLEKIERFKNYMIPSGGGVTISGGEPLLQTKFLIKLLDKLKQNGIPVAIDTSGSVELTEEIKEIIDLTDLFLLDIKCINDTICKELTGVSNKKELEFARYLSDKNKDMWIRQVLIPTITDNEVDLKELKVFIDSLKTVKKVEILPYHDMGKFKWEELEINYNLEGIKSPTNEEIQKAKKILGID